MNTFCVQNCILGLCHSFVFCLKFDWCKKQTQLYFFIGDCEWRGVPINVKMENITAICEITSASEIKIIKDSVEKICLDEGNVMDRDYVVEIGNVFATLWDIYNPFGDSISPESMLLLKNNEHFGEFENRRRKNLYEIFHVKVPLSPLALMHRKLMDSSDHFKQLYLNEYLFYFKQHNESMRYSLPYKTVDVISASKPTIVRILRSRPAGNGLNYSKRSGRNGGNLIHPINANK